jgi:hypothetical protein
MAVKAGTVDPVEKGIITHKNLLEDGIECPVFDSCIELAAFSLPDEKARMELL